MRPLAASMAAAAAGPFNYILFSLFILINLIFRCFALLATADADATLLFFYQISD